MESKTSNLVRGRKKLRYFTNDEGSAPRIKEVFSVRDIDEFLDCASKTKLDSGFLSPFLLKGTPEAEEEEEETEEAQQEAECVALPTKEKNIGEDGLTDKESPFKDSAPLKTSSPIVEATSTLEVCEGQEKPLGLALLLADDNEDPIDGNMDKSLSVQTEDLAKEPTVIETLTLTPTKKFTLAVNTQEDKSPILTPLKGRSQMNLREKILASVSENDIQIEVNMNEEQSSSVSPVVSAHTVDVEPMVEAIKEPDSTRKASNTSSDGSFQKKLREFLMPRNLESARMPVPLRAPSPQELDEDFLILEDEAPLLFSLKPKTQSQTSRAAKQSSKKAEAETAPDAVDGALSGTEIEPGSNGITARAASTSQQTQAKATAVQKKRGKQGKAAESGDGAGVSGKGNKVEDDTSPPSEALPKAPHVQKKKKDKWGKSSGKGEGAKEAAPGPEKILAEASSPSVPPPKASVAHRERGKRGKQPVSRAEPEEEDHEKGAGNTATAVSSKVARATQKKRGRTAAAVTAAEPQIAEDADTNMDSTEFERRPATPKSKAHAPTAPEEEEEEEEEIMEMNTRDYGHSPALISTIEVPEQTVTKKARKNTLQREKPFLNKKTKKRNLLRRTSDMFSVSSSPELKSDPKASKAASSTLRPAKTDKSANSAAVPSCLNLKTKNKKKEKESKAVEKRKRLRAAPPEKAGKEGDEGQGFTQSDSPLREDQLDATGDSEARQQEPSLDISGSSAMSKRKRNKPGNWWEVNPERGDEDSVAASSPPKRPKVNRRDVGKKSKKAGKQVKEAAASLEQDSAGVVDERARSAAKLPRQQKDGKAVLKSRQRKVKGDAWAGQKRLQTSKGRQRKLQEEDTLALANHVGEEVEAETHQAASLQVNMSSEAPGSVRNSRDGEAVSRTDVPRPQGRHRRSPSNWWEGQKQQQPEPEEDIIPSPSPPHPAPEPRARVPTPGMRASELRIGRAGKLGSGSRKPCNQLRKIPTPRRAGSPKTLKGSLAAFGAIYTSGKTRGRNAAVQNVRKNLLNSLEDSSNRSNDHMSIDGSSQPDCDDVNREACNRVSTSVVLDSVVRLKTGDVLPASGWPSQNLGVAGLKSGPSSMVEIQSFEDEEEDQTLPSSLRIPMALSEGDICGPLLRPLTLVPDDWQNLTYWLRKVWQTNLKHSGQLITADHFHWYMHEGRALGHKFDLVCSSYANGKLLLGSYMRKPEQVDQHTTTVFNVYTSSVRVQISDLKSDYYPGQAFVVPRGQSYSIRNLTPVPAILWYHRMFLDIMEDS